MLAQGHLKLCAGTGFPHPRSREGKPLPTRRTLELIVVAAVAMRPVFGLVRLWSQKTLATSPAGSVSHGAAEIGNVVA